jgi:hypothetical protein
MNDREFRQLKEREDAVVLDYTDYARKVLYVSGVSRHISGRNLEIFEETAAKFATNSPMEAGTGDRH